jgi:hypothetical protein
VEIEVELGVVLLDDHPGGLLDRFGTDATHDEGQKGSRIRNGEPNGDQVSRKRKEQKKQKKKMKN